MEVRTTYLRTTNCLMFALGLVFFSSGAQINKWIGWMQRSFDRTRSSLMVVQLRRESKTSPRHDPRTLQLLQSKNPFFNGLQSSGLVRKITRSNRRIICEPIRRLAGGARNGKMRKRSASILRKRTPPSSAKKKRISRLQLGRTRSWMEWKRWQRRGDFEMIPAVSWSGRT